MCPLWKHPVLAAVSLPMEKFDYGLGERTLKQPPKFMLHRIMSKFLGVVSISEGRYIIASIQKFVVL